MFAIEILMPEVSARTFLAVAIATSTATFIGRYWFGVAPSFTMPQLAPLPIDATAALALCLYTVLGAIVGLAAAAFVRGLYFTEDLFDRIPGNYFRHMLGMLVVGAIIYGVQQAFCEYYIGGVGYATDQAILFGHLTGAGILFALFFCELVATCLTLGSGSSGGFFSPSLNMGATLGSGFATVLNMLHLPMTLNIPSFAVVGMAAMVGGGTGAVLTAITMLFETLLLQTLLRDERVGSSFEGCVRWTQRGLRLGLAELGFWTRRNAPRRSGNWRWPKRTIRSTLRLTLSMRPCCLVRLLLRPRSRSRRRTMPRLRKTCCRRSGGVGLRALAVRTAVGTTFALGARLAASLGTAARVAGRHSTR